MDINFDGTLTIPDMIFYAKTDAKAVETAKKLFNKKLEERHKEVFGERPINIEIEANLATKYSPRTGAIYTAIEKIPVGYNSHIYRTVNRRYVNRKILMDKNGNISTRGWYEFDEHGNPTIPARDPVIGWLTQVYKRISE